MPACTDPRDERPAPQRPAPPPRYYGKYRGEVVLNTDLKNLGRVKAFVPAVPGAERSWAWPCVPYAGPGVGFAFTPPIGANVWVEFEGGDPSHPIWSGCFWASGERPPEAADPAISVFKTESFSVRIVDPPPPAFSFSEAEAAEEAAEEAEEEAQEEGACVIQFGEPAWKIPVTITVTDEGLLVQTADTLVTINGETVSTVVGEASAVITPEGANLEVEGAVGIESEEVNVTAVDVSIEANLSVTGPTEVEGDVEIVGATEVEGDVEILGATEVEGDVEIVGATEVEGDVAIVGATEIEGETEVTGAMEIIGDTTIVGVEEVVGDAVQTAIETDGYGSFVAGIP